jgi:hypothetical protein
MNFPLAPLLGCDNGWVHQFQHLIEADPPELLIWESHALRAVRSL